MVLSDRSIREKLVKKEIIIQPVEDWQIGPSSVDLHLNSDFAKLRESDFNRIGGIKKPIDLNKKINYDYFDIDNYHLILKPKQFILANTIERIKLPDNICASVQNRSSIGRLGLFIENAGWIDPGFEGHITLELFNAGNIPIKLVKGIKLCQIIFSELDREVDKSYNGRYLNQEGVTGSRFKI